MTRTRSTDASARSRRRFLKLAALGSVAVVTAALPRGSRAAGTVKKVRKPKAPAAPTPNAVETEVARQRATMADLLKTIRNYELPSGSEPGFVFVPSKAPKPDKKKRGAR